VIVFGCAAVRFALARPGATARRGPVSLPGAHHALMAGAMTWMITAMQAAMPMAGPGHASDPIPPTPAPVVPSMSHAAMTATPDPAIPAMSHAAVPAMADPAMPAMSHVAVPATVLAVGVLLAAYFALAAIPWLVRAVGPGPRINDRAAAGHAAMSAGMAAMLVAML
jgi:uncharacterized protein DUF5134